MYVFIYLFIQQHSDEDFNQEEDEGHNNIRKVSLAGCLPKHLKDYI